jgi:hypothetical protein
MTNEETHQAFLETVYTVFNNPNFDIRINEIVDEKSSLASWAFITAWNPLPKIESLEQNRQRNNKLENDIKQLGLVYMNGLGVSKDGSWSEESFFIENISLDKAKELAVKYGQLAFVFGTKNNKATLVYNK